MFDVSTVAARSWRALNRKNNLFAGHDEGAAAWSRIATLTETAEMNGVNPHACFKATLEAIANGHPATEIDQLPPWVSAPNSSCKPGGADAPRFVIMHTPPNGTMSAEGHMYECLANGAESRSRRVLA